MIKDFSESDCMEILEEKTISESTVNWEPYTRNALKSKVRKRKLSARYCNPDCKLPPRLMSEQEEEYLLSLSCSWKDALANYAWQLQEAGKQFGEQPEKMELARKYWERQKELKRHEVMEINSNGWTTGIQW